MPMLKWFWNNNFLNSNLKINIGILNKSIDASRPFRKIKDKIKR